ncbi:MAG: hypothetical protein ACUVXI_10445 [bacterium]
MRDGNFNPVTLGILTIASGILVWFLLSIPFVRGMILFVSVALTLLSGFATFTILRKNRRDRSGRVMLFATAALVIVDFIVRKIPLILPISLVGLGGFLMFSPLLRRRSGGRDLTVRDDGSEE